MAFDGESVERGPKAPNQVYDFAPTVGLGTRAKKSPGKRLAGRLGVMRASSQR